MVTKPKRLKIPKALWWKLDLDYLNKLSPKDRAWLNEALDAHYNNNFRTKVGKKIPKAKHSEMYAQNRAAREDITQGYWASSEIREEIHQEQQDLSPTPEYLDSKEYKEALQEYRKHLSPTRGVIRISDPSTNPDEYSTALDRLKKSKK